jgi:uncharacterized membrane protein YkoI
MVATVFAAAASLSAGVVCAQVPAQHPVAVTRPQAEATALQRVPGTVRHYEFEREHGRWIHSFAIRTAAGVPMEVNVDAETGAIVEVSRD